MGLELGTHVLALKAWDTYNNSSRVEVNFEIVQNNEQIIKNALFYPNPLVGKFGHFTYTAETEAEASRIKIFTLDGNLVETLDSKHAKGFNQVEWQKPDNLSNGTYIYKVELIGSSNVIAAHSGPLQILR